MSIKSFAQHSWWQEMVSLCSLIRLIGVCADRDQPEFLCSRSDSRDLEVHVATAGGWLTRYRPREVRNSIYRYWKIHIDYRSKFLYRFISSISIIYGNTSFNAYVLAKTRKMLYFDSYFSLKLGKMYSFDPPFFLTLVVFRVDRRSWASLSETWPSKYLMLKACWLWFVIFKKKYWEFNQA